MDAAHDWLYTSTNPIIGEKNEIQEIPRASIQVGLSERPRVFSNPYNLQLQAYKIIRSWVLSEVHWFAVFRLDLGWK